jgi:hypothetical protein
VLRTPPFRPPHRATRLAAARRPPPARLSERYSTADGGMGSAELKLRDARAEIEQLHSRMALYSLWVGGGGQDALKMRQWSRHDQQLRARLQAERGAHDQAWFRAADLQAAAARAGSIY